jgi:two-component system sensor histidine kinase PilS (NtrC family)
MELYHARLATGDILRHLNSGLLTMTGQGEIVFFNHAAESILDLKGSEVSGRDCRNVFAGRLQPLADGLLEALASGQQTSRQEFEISDGGGRALPIGVSTSILFNHDGTPRGLIAIFQDLTQAKIMEERMRHADRMAAVGELAASMAHEIRNPLAAISGSVEVLKNDLTVSGDDEKLLSLIITESGRLNKILSDFLMYARVGRTQFRKIDVQGIISDTIEIVRRHPAFSPAMTIEVEPAGGLTYIFGDADQLKQLLLNLAVNACEVLGDTGGVIQFGATAFTDPDGERMVAVTVRDTGPGIPADILDKIFLPFFSTKKKGTGLGLAIVSRLIEAHNGRIEVSSILGHGTEFRLYFQGLADDGVARHPDVAESFSSLR